MLFMRTILSLSLATFTFAIPVAQPQAVGDLGGVGLIGRVDDQVFANVFKGLNNIVDGFLGSAFNSGGLHQQTFGQFLGQIDEIARCALKDAGDSGLDGDAINSVLQEIETVAGIDFNDTVNAGNITQDVVHNMLVAIDNFLAPVLDGSSDGSSEVLLPGIDSDGAS